MKRLFPACMLICLLCSASFLQAQSNITVTNSLADQVLRGNYSPALFAATNVVDQPDSLTRGVQDRISPDSLLSYLEALTGFGNRNTGSDTVSSTWGIGAARRWAHAKFADISARNENRLLVGYLQFDRNICSMTQHRNVMAVLPGSDSTTDGFILMEAHMDSRCDVPCGGGCNAQGADDNGSGSALVLELARVLSAYTFDHTMVFMLTIGEEQGLFGAEALAEYCTQQGIPVKAVLNNDIVGGIYCGNSASPPGCPGAGDIDSLNVRLFSHGGFNSPHKQLARFIKLQYQEELTGQIPTEMDLHIMSNEDRTGRGGDHIPFRQNGFSAMRFTSANEHGDGSPDAQYTDRQHTSDDSLGLDLDNDGDLDTFFVDFNYLARNAVINGNAAAMIGIGPETPDFTVTAASGGAEITIITQTQYSTYRVGVRSVDNDWDSVYTMAGTLDTLFGLPQGVTVIYSVASVDSNGIESLFSREKTTTIANLDAPIPGQMELLQNRPNPFDEQTIISVNVAQRPDFEEAYIRIVDAAGKEVQKIPITLEMDMNEVYFYHGFHAEGVYFYSLVIDGETWATRKMVMQR